jgi:hypothetical protein
METLGSSIWVRLHIVATLIWLGVTGYEVVVYPGSVEVQIKLAVAALTGAVVIMTIGLCIQVAVNSVTGMLR